MIEHLSEQQRCENMWVELIAAPSLDLILLMNAQHENHPTFQFKHPQSTCDMNTGREGWQRIEVKAQEMETHASIFELSHGSNI